jgi:hypothetical protein
LQARRLPATEDRHADQEKPEGTYLTGQGGSAGADGTEAVAGPESRASPLLDRQACQR